MPNYISFSFSFAFCFTRIFEQQEYQEAESDNQKLDEPEESEEKVELVKEEKPLESAQEEPEPKGEEVPNLPLISMEDTDLLVRPIIDHQLKLSSNLKLR